ncbi:MAG: type IX secretion system sortase PorU [Clostridium sp.]|nr:type IX secretion system sortase PorU [Clostridium sp.]
MNIHLPRALSALLLMACAFISAAAFSPDTYAGASRLAEGKWVKVSVPSTGMYAITAAQLRQWGFSDITKVRVYGYGGARIPDKLEASTYIDDLPMQQTFRTDRGIVFYAVGPEGWQRSSKNAYINESNIYSTKGYYFISESDEEETAIEKQATSPAQGSAFANTYVARWHYEYDRTSPGEAGWLLVGESLKAQPTRKVTFDNMPAGKYTMECGIVSQSSFASKMNFAVNGAKLETASSDNIPASSKEAYVHGTHTSSKHEFAFEGGRMEITITVDKSASMTDCWLDYVSLNSEQALALPSSGQLAFETTSRSKTAISAQADAIIWDVTDPLRISQANAVEIDGKLSWESEYGTNRKYAAFLPGAAFPSPSFEGTVANQNLHGIDTPDMVIFTLPEYAAASRRIAEMHASAARPLKAEVIDVNQVYNEFSSGTPDVSALRKCLKMLYDRGGQNGHKLEYALLMGRSTYDNRRLSSAFDSKSSYGTIPCWMGGTRKEQLSDNTGYGTDDFIAMLADGSGDKKGSDELLVAVGRIPARNQQEADQAAEKLAKYMQKGKPGTWRNSFVFLADDGDEGIHAEETEMMIANMLETPKAQNLFTKVYVDAYDIVAGSCDGGRAEMYRALNEGAVWWNFSGHANNHSWTGENMLNFTDINSMYLKNVPVILAATCDFLRWDSNTLSGGEILYSEPNGGCIAMISATRPVYISLNGHFTRAVGRAINQRDENGNILPIGEIYRRAKNNILDREGKPETSTNRLRYVLMGDPALQLALPSNIVHLDKVGNTAVGGEDQVIIAALQRVDLEGSVTTPDGRVLEDFNGSVTVSIYDAERSMLTKGKREHNKEIAFDQRGEKLFAGSAKVENGRFKINVAMPAEISDNFRPATINMYAYADDMSADAAGVNRDCYVYGFDESAPADNTPPSIDRLVLNHDSFADGGTVNDTPMLIADVSDDVGINLSTAGIGHQMTITVDGRRTYTDVANYYTPSADGSPSGTIAYPLSSLDDGAHSLKLRIFDTSGNSASREIGFSSIAGLKPNVYETYCTPNPASEYTNFYLSHDRPDAELTVTLTVYSLMGRPVWSKTVKSKADMFETQPITWDLTDMAGRRVPRGIYLYRAAISADGQSYTTQNRKLAVTAQ